VLDEVNQAVLSASGGRALDDVGTFVVQHIRRRTKKGISIEGKRFVRYSKRYARRKKGNRRTPVTLTDKGAMLRGVRKRRRGGDRMTVRVDANLAAAIAHQRGLGRVPRRAWFGLTLEARGQAERIWGGVINESVPHEIERRFTIRVNF